MAFSRTSDEGLEGKPGITVGLGADSAALASSEALVASASTLLASTASEAFFSSSAFLSS